MGDAKKWSGYFEGVHGGRRKAQAEGIDPTVRFDPNLNVCGLSCVDVAGLLHL